jgi:G3E family GTPase
LLSKSDLVDAAEVERLIPRLRRINPRASIVKMDFGRAPIYEVLDLRGFNLNEKLEIAPDFLSSQAIALEPAHEHGHAHEHCGDAHCDHANPQHTDDITAFAFKSEQPFDTALLDEFLGGLVQVYGPRMLRYKGVLWINGTDRKVIFQGIHQIMGSDIGGKWAPDEVRSSKMVFIGKNLPKDTFIRGLEQCLV